LFLSLSLSLSKLSDTFPVLYRSSIRSSNMSEKNERIVGSSDVGTMKVENSTPASSSDDRLKLESSSGTNSKSFDWSKGGSPTSTSPSVKSKPYGQEFFYRLTHPALLNPNKANTNASNSNLTTNTTSITTTTTSPPTFEKSKSMIETTRPFSRPRSSSLPFFHSFTHTKSSPSGRTVSDEAIEAAMIL